MTDSNDEPLQRTLLPVRKRAPLTGTSFDFIRVGVSCPQCKKEGLQPLAELEVNTDADCPYCGHVIDLSSPDWRTKIGEVGFSDFTKTSCPQAFSRGSNSSALSRSMARNSAAVNPPLSATPLPTAAAVPPPNGKSVPNTMCDTGTSFLNEGSV